MKKIYIIPTQKIVEIEGGILMSVSSLNESGSDGNVYVKGDNMSDRNTSSYSVWDDDWSK